MSETVEIDWRGVFKRYANYVAECEGTDFLGPPGAAGVDLGGFARELSPEEAAAVFAAREELRATWPGHTAPPPNHMREQ